MASMRFGELWRTGHLIDLRGREIGFLIGLCAALELAAGIGLSYVAGFADVQHVLGDMLVRWPWLLGLAASLIVSFAGYYLAYDGIFTLERGPRLTPRQMRVVVTAGFGGFLSHGGSSLDTHALTSAGCGKREASVRVWGLAGLEQGVLSLAACVAAIVMLATGRNVPPLNFTLPWAVIPVPGFLLAFWLAERYRGRLRDRRGGAGKAGLFLDSIHLVRRLFVTPGRRHARRRAAGRPGRPRVAAAATGSAEEHLGLGVALLRHPLGLAGRVGQRHAHDVGAAQRHHRPERAVADRADRVHAVPGGQHPVERGRRAAALDVAEHRTAGFLAGPLLDLRGQQLADAAQPDVAERVQLPGADLALLAGRVRALRDHHDRRVPGLEAVLHVGADLLDAERLLRDQDDVRAAGQARVQRDPADAAPHHLHDQRAVVALGRGVQPVDG